MINILEATQFAIKKHGMARRKYTGDLYVTHPIAVALMMKDVGFVSDDAIIVALWHDLIEDTDTTYSDIALLTNEKVVQGVLYCTNLTHEHDVLRDKRKLLDAEHYANGNLISQSVKVLDAVHNCRCIMSNDPIFAKTYIPEKERLVRMLSQAHPNAVALWDELYNQWRECNE